MKYLYLIKKITRDDIKSVLWLFLIQILTLFEKKQKHPILLITERKDCADDNAWMFFRWLKSQDTNDEFYFLLNKNAANFNNHDPHMIPWASFRHYRLYVKKHIQIMATFNTPKPNNRVCSYYDRIFHRNISKVYLKHGITVSGMEKHLYKLHHFRLYLCGAKPEYDFVLNSSDYPEKNVKYTGFARFDDLLLRKRDDHFILLMPTWRRYIGCNNLISKEDNINNFKNSIYYKRYASLLHNKKLVDFLHTNGLKIRYCLHPEYRKFKNCFESDIPEVEIVGENESIHELLLSTSLVITDYSSVFFDAAYAEKPVIYYQFDYKEFREQHLSEGYFSFENDGFGPVLHSENDLIYVIINTWKGYQFISDPMYIERRNTFFPLHDTKNCERIYNQIQTLYK